MVSVEKAVIARLTKGGADFEILVDSVKALEFRQGKPHGMEGILAVNDVFKDARKGERVSPSDLEKAFGTADVLQVAATIIREGQLQLTTEQRRDMVDEKRKQIADIISKQGINPQTKLPNPPNRILNAMEQAKVTVDPFRPAEEQVNGVVDQIQSVIPIGFERVEVTIRIPVQYAGKAGALVRRMAPIKKEEWKSDVWVAVVEIPAGMQSDIYDKLNKVAGGQVDIKVTKRAEV
jgi:ribosome maturation protein SDO1